MKKIYTRILAALFVIVALSGCGSTASDKDIKTASDPIISSDFNAPSVSDGAESFFAESNRVTSSEAIKAGIVSQDSISSSLSVVSNTTSMSSSSKGSSSGSKPVTSEGETTGLAKTSVTTSIIAESSISQVTAGTGSQRSGAVSSAPSSSAGTSSVSAITSSNPLPAASQTGSQPTTGGSITISIHCDTAVTNWDNLKKSKQDNRVVPANGVILSATTVTFSAGETVFDVLARVCQQKGIQMEHKGYAAYNSEYIEGINNLYEFDCGNLSGWMYCVNGWYPNYGCSQYLLKNGDNIEWNYTCDLGEDLGQHWVGGSE